MKLKNNWKYYKNWTRFSFKLSLLSLDILAIEVDKNRNFYMFVLLNFVIKNR